MVDLSVDIDAEETEDWLNSIEAVLERDGPERAHFLLEKLIDKARRSGAHLPYTATTAYINTIPVGQEPSLPGDPELEARIRAIVRWNAVAMVLRAGRKASELGGHIASYASSATLYEMGFNHFFHAPTASHGGDLLYIQGHVSPGIYARSFLEGRLSAEQLDSFRQEVQGGGLSSYPHPWLMPDYWQFPTVSMGLGPLQAIYQARFMKYLHNRGLIDASKRKIWCFCGDGEMDEPESLGAISLAGREKLDNLIFVINCNLQRLDGPVRGNSKVIQEFEGVFRGAGWNAIKVIWGRHWDPLFQKDAKGLLLKRMEECVDGDYQNYKAHGGAYTREHFFGKYAELKAMVANLSDEDIWRLNRGGHDPSKVYAAYDKAVNHEGQPTVILAKTVKGYGMGDAGEAQNITHQQKKMDVESLRQFRDRFNIPVSDKDLEDLPYYRPAEDSAEMQYLHERRAALGGYLPKRRAAFKSLTMPELSAFAPLLKDSGDREISTTMAFVRILSTLVKDKSIKKYIVPIVPDEARTFGMEGMFRQLGIYSSVGQLYKPMDVGQVMYYREDIKGQILEEGITEAGAFSSWLAAATSYSNHDVPMIPFYIYYSMFGFQRIGDLAWAAGDSRARGFLIGGTAGRTTLAGEGLQHCDGHSHLMAQTIPSCITYDPTYAYELAVIIQDGLKRMFENNEQVFYYITTMNENYHHPEMPEGVEQGIIKGMYRLSEGAKLDSGLKVQLMGSGAILREVEKAQKLLAERFDISADVWSVTSFNELRRDGLQAVRRNRLHPDSEPVVPYVTEQLSASEGPVIAATDYMQSYADGIREYVPNQFVSLGTDGYGRSDTRKQLRHFFEVDAKFIVQAALKALADEGKLSAEKVMQAMKELSIDSEKVDPTLV